MSARAAARINAWAHALSYLYSGRVELVETLFVVKAETLTLTLSLQAEGAAG